MKIELFHVEQGLPTLFSDNPDKLAPPHTHWKQVYTHTHARTHSRHHYADVNFYFHIAHKSWASDPGEQLAKSNSKDYLFITRHFLCDYSHDLRAENVKACTDFLKSRAVC